MTRIAPLLTLASVAVLGAGLFATNYLATPTAPPVPLAAAAPEVAAAPAAPVAPETPETPVPAEVVAPAEPARPAEPVEPGTAYAGWTVGMGLTVAMTMVDEEVVAYVCDGEQVEVWLRGSVEDGVLDLSNAQGATLTGTADDSWAEGTVTFDGAQWSFTAEPIEAAAASAAGRGDVAQVAERAGMDY